MKKITFFLFMTVAGVCAQSWTQAPFIRFHPENVTVSKGTQIKLACFVMGFPRPVVTWYKNEVLINANTQTGVSILPDESLVIEKARRNSKNDDSGVYYCVTKNTVGIATSDKATVIVKYLDRDFKLVPVNASIPDIGTHTFKCIPPSGYPPPIVTWQKDGSPIKLLNTRSQRNGAEYQLTISPVSWSNTGLYSCVATNSEGQRISPAAVLELAITAPDVDMLKNKVIAYEGKNAVFNCFTIRMPQPDRSWSKVGGTMPPETRLHQTNDGFLTISSLQLSDHGIYKCTANNSMGMDSETVELEVYKQMKFEVMPIGASVGLGKTAIFDCKVQGGKNPIPFWKIKGDIVYQHQTGKRGYVTDTNRLVIEKVEPMDEGVIKCNAHDSGEASTTISSTDVMLQVLSSSVSSPVITLTPPADTVTEGGSFSLTCRAIGNGDYKFEWIVASRNEIINSGTTGVKFKTKSTDSMLMLTSVIMSDSGTYRCKVTSPEGATNSKVSYLTVNATGAGRPTQVTYVKVTDVKARSLKLTWGIPSSNSLAPITSYVITIREDRTGTERKTVVTDEMSTEKLITNLNPSTVYLFLVAARNKNGDGLRRSTGHIETKRASVVGVIDKLENVALKLSVGHVTDNSIEFTWNYVQPSRITSYALYSREDGIAGFKQIILQSNTIRSYKLTNLKSNMEYEIYLKAVNEQYLSPESSHVIVKTTTKVPAPIKVGMEKIDDRNLQVHWSPPPNFDDIEDVLSYELTCLYDRGKAPFFSINPNKQATISTLSGLDPYEMYYIYVRIKTTTGYGQKSKAFTVQLVSMKVGEVYGAPLTTKKVAEDEEEDGGLMKIVKETWFIVTVGVLLWLLLLAIVLLLCCRRNTSWCMRKRRNMHYESSRGLMNHPDYPNTSLNRTNETYDPARTGTGKKSISSCCKSQSSSINDDFPNRADIKPLMTYTRHESVEMKTKNSNGDLNLKESNIGVAMKNGYMVDTPLNNEIDYRYQPDNRFYDSGDDRPPPRYRGMDQNGPSSGSMPRRDPRYQTNSVERRHAEIVRTAANKTFPDADLVNVMENNPQASWKREKAKDSPRLSNKPPGENTLRRQAKTQFKPLPKLELLNWADGLPTPSKAPSTNGSQPSSPKMSSSASMFSENTDPRADSRMSHGDSSNSLNKYPYEKRRRRNSNASSMMSSELYQSEMDPSGYSDVVSDKKRKKEKSIPPPIDLDGLTSDILLQWAESVTNSSPSSSGSSSPDRLSGISSEGSIYTDEDFAQAVAAVVECGGFNMDYDYSLPGMPGTQAPLSASRNIKMNKIDQVLAQRSKMRNSPAASVQSRPREPVSVANSFVPQISMSGYLTGSQKGPQSTHSAPSGIPRSTKYKSPADKKLHGRYGTGFQDVDSVSTTSSSNPLTMSNLLQHDSSLERGKKTGSKPLTVSNLRQHETSLDRGRIRQQPAAPVGRVPSNKHDAYNESRRRSNPALLPEAPLSVTSALERNESMHSNSKDSINSSTKHDSEVENTTGTSERKPRNKKYLMNTRANPLSSTSTIDTVRTSPDHGDDTDC